MTSGDKIRELRTRHNLSQKKLADLVGVSKSRIGRIERGEFKAKFDEIIGLARIFQVSTDYLAG